jgi:hypothetical protein
MGDRTHNVGGRGPSTPPPARHSNTAEPTDPTVRADDAVDDELVSDLGAEFELRGDVMESELEAARAEAMELRDRVLRGQAEFDNFRKRRSGSGPHGASSPSCFLQSTTSSAPSITAWSRAPSP